jgi:FkbM family methyltransferase
MNPLFRSLQLDLQTLAYRAAPLSQRLDLITKKYLTYLGLVSVKGGKTLNLFGKPFFMMDKMDVVVMQVNLFDNQLLEKYIKPGAIILDVGANIGQFNRFSHDILKAGKVISVEPLPECFEALQKNAAKDDVCIHAAIAEGKELELHFDDTTLTASSVRTDTVTHSIIVPAKRVDDIEQLKEYKQIDLFKIDTEGTELEVVKTATKTLKKSKYLFIESSVTRESSGELAVGRSAVGSRRRGGRRRG